MLHADEQLAGLTIERVADIRDGVELNSAGLAVDQPPEVDAADAGLLCELVA